MLGVSRVTLYRWLREGFIIGEQLMPGAPWRIRIDDAVRARVVGDAPAVLMLVQFDDMAPPSACQV